jgi:putative phosphoribosyl transferase
MALFSTREQGGERLAALLDARYDMPIDNPVVLGIARGGIPVGYPVARTLGCALEALVLRKLPLPHEPEAGFGAVTLDKTIVINERLRAAGDISERQVQGIVERVYEEVVRRDRVYRGKEPFPSLAGRTAVITDDGLASGYTMLAAVEYARRKGAGTVIAAAPVAHGAAQRLVEQSADAAITAYVDSAAVFAVASFYEQFPEISDSEALAYLRS